MDQDRLDVTGVQVGDDANNQQLENNLASFLRMRDEHRAEQEVQVANVRHQQNALLPINRLPPELLSRVFLELSLERDQALEPSRLRLMRSWLAVTYICRRWRSVAIDCAMLWTNIPLKLGKLWSQAFVLRSKAAAIEVEVGSPFRTNLAAEQSWILDIIREQFPRVGVAHIYGYSNARAWCELLASYIPHHIHELVLEPLHALGDALELTSDSMLSQAHELQVLTINSISFTWNDLPWVGLRSLSISNPPAKSSTADPTLLITCLHLATALEEFHLDIETHPFTKSVGVNTTSASLTRLRAFSLTGQAADCTTLLNAVRLPPTASLLIHILSDARGAAVHSIVTELLQPHVGRAVSEPHARIQTLYVTAGLDDGDVNVKAWHSDNPLYSDRAFIDISLSSESSEDFHSNLSHICRRLKTSSLRRLHVKITDYHDCSSLTGWKKSSWHKMFSKAKRVHTVLFDGPCAYEFFKALSMPIVSVPAATDVQPTPTENASANAQESIHPPRSAMMFPSLRALDMSRVRCDIPGHDWCTLSGDVKRRACSAPLKTLRLTECAIDNETVGELERTEGLKVDWDGVNVDDDSDYDDSEDDDSEECDFCDGEGCEECIDDYFVPGWH